MIKKRRKDQNSKTIAKETEEKDSLHSLIAQLPLPPPHSSESTENFDSSLLKTSDVFPEDLEASVETELVEKIAVLQKENEKLMKEKSSIELLLANQKSVAEQKKINKTNQWKIGNLENQLKWQRDENLRIVAEHRQKYAQILEEKKQLVENIKSIGTHADINKSSPKNRCEVAILRSFNKKLMEEKRILSDDRSQIEALLLNQKKENKSLNAQNSRNTELLAEQKNINKTNCSKIGNLEKQLKEQKDENSRMINKLENEKSRIISDGIVLLENQKIEHNRIVMVYRNEQKKMLKEKQELTDKLNSKVEEKRRIIAALESADKKLIEEKRIQSDDKSETERKLLYHSFQNDSLIAQIQSLEKQLKSQKDSNSKIKENQDADFVLMNQQKGIIKANYRKIVELEELLDSQEEKYLKTINSWRHQYEKDVGILRQTLRKLERKYSKIELNYSESEEYNDSSVEKVLEKSKQPEPQSMLLLWISGSWKLMCKPFNRVVSFRARYGYFFYDVIYSFVTPIEMGRRKPRKNGKKKPEEAGNDESESMDNLIAQLPRLPISPSDSSRNLEITENQLENRIVTIEPKNKIIPKTSNSTLESALWKKIAELENEKSQIISDGIVLLEKQQLEHNKIVMVYRNEQKKMLEETQALKEEAEKKQRIVTESQSILKDRDNVIRNKSKLIESLNSKMSNWDRDKARMVKKYETEKKAMLEAQKEKLKLKNKEHETEVRKLQKELKESKALIVMQKLGTDNIISTYQNEKQKLRDDHDRLIVAKTNQIGFLDSRLVSVQSELDRLEKEHAREMETRTGLWYFVSTPFRWFWPLRKRHKAAVIFGCLIVIFAFCNRRPPPAHIDFSPRYYDIPVKCDCDYESAFRYLPLFINS
ncbi:unnamed protein product [Caenorhabditis brenneri]